MIQYINHIFKLQFLLILSAILGGIFYPQILELLQNKFKGKSIDVHYESAQKQQEKVFTKEELAHFDGEDGSPIYLALLGRVYDVSKGAKHYGPGCGYNFFVGRDASVSFITGEFDNFVEGEADDVNSLKPNDLISLENWQKFYEKDYVYKGKLIGRFYDEQGLPTKYYHKYHELLAIAKNYKEAKEQLRVRYPDCNIEWSETKGSHVWCTSNSGGTERHWIGYPRQLFEIGSDNFRCACVRKEDLDNKEVMLKPYDNCDSLAMECYYKVD